MLSMNFDVIYACIIFTSSITLILLYICRWRNFLLPLKYPTKRTEKVSSAPFISVIIPTHNSLKDLKSNLNAIIHQDYPNFEIIFIDQSSDDDTMLYIEQLEKKYNNIRHTFVPSSSRHINKNTLALTLGIKASYGEFCLLTKPQCKPSHSLWIKNMSSLITSDIDIVIGRTIYDNNSFQTSIRNIDKAQLFIKTIKSIQTGKAYSGDSGNILIKKDFFIQNKGFSSHLSLPFGEISFFVNRLSTQKNTTIAVTSETLTIEQPPIKKILKQECLYESKIEKTINNKRIKLNDKTANIALYTYITLNITYIITCLIQFYHHTEHYFISDIIMFALFLLCIFIPLWCIKKCHKVFTDTPFSSIYPFYALFLPIRKFFIKIKCKYYSDGFTRSYL